MVLRAPTLDPRNPFNWRSSAAAEGNPGIQDSVAFSGTPGADDDGDGLSAVLEYCLGGSDSAPGDVVRPWLGTASIDTGSGPQIYLTIEATQNLAADSATLIAEFSTDLATWSSGAPVYLGETVNANGIATRRWRAPDPISVGEKQFLRVRASLP
jgi:hypothetical protein